MSGAPEPAETVGERDKVLIAAAAVAVLGTEISIGEIRQVPKPFAGGWARQRRVSIEVARIQARRRMNAPRQPVRREKKGEAPDHA
jgi:hypothetical protein